MGEMQKKLSGDSKPLQDSVTSQLDEQERHEDLSEARDASLLKS